MGKIPQQQFLLSLASLSFSFMHINWTLLKARWSAFENCVTRKNASKDS